MLQNLHPDDGDNDEEDENTPLIKKEHKKQSLPNKSKLGECYKFYYTGQYFLLQASLYGAYQILNFFT